MTDEARTIRDRVDAAIDRELTPEPPKNPAADGHREAFEADITAAWNESFGADPLIDGALKGIRQRAVEVTAVIEDVAVSRRDVAAGRSPREKTEAEITETIEREKKATERALEAAQKAVEVGRERLVRELLPEPTRGVTSSETKADLQLIVSGFEEVADGFRHAVRQAVRADDREALGLLAGSFGEALYRARGGSAETYEALRLELIAAVAEAVTRRSPRSTEARKWRVALANPASRYINGEGLRTALRLKDLQGS